MALTELLNIWRAQGNQIEAGDFDQIFLELRRLAKAVILRERPNHTLQATELVHEIYLKMDHQKVPQWSNRAHFFSVAALMMRRILVDHARQKSREKRGGSDHRVTLKDDLALAKGPCLDVLEINRVLEELHQLDTRNALVVELKLFGGLTEEEIGVVLGVSARTVKRDWRFAKGWMKMKLSDTPSKT